MTIRNLYDAKRWFEVLQTTRNAQTAAMTLAPGKSTGEEPEAHPHSEQILFLIRGELSAQIGRRRRKIKAGDVVIIPEKIKHKFTNRGKTKAVTFNVYIPPEYPRGMKE